MAKQCNAIFFTEIKSLYVDCVCISKGSFEMIKIIERELSFKVKIRYVCRVNPKFSQELGTPRSTVGRVRKSVRPCVGELLSVCPVLLI